MQQLFIGDLSLSDGVIESVVLSESEVRVGFRLWDGSKARFWFTGVIGMKDRNSVGQDIESLDTESGASIFQGAEGAFAAELLEERRADRTAPITRYSFIGSWMMNPILEVYAEEMDVQRTNGF
ncbi:hypothetical protein [Saccharibacillus deserti]|uniref:hypothetical protein n=1 Tax=Saccharibacillus deserti TaxID=1634444 RepID=UPI001556F392|nr:hypothetical protein [Saccharibacillus deserti]